MPTNPAAASWSATGAIIAAARTPPRASEPAAFALAMNALAAVVDSGPQSWNDDPSRTQKEVLAALSAAHAHLLAAELLRRR